MVTSKIKYINNLLHIRDSICLSVDSDNHHVFNFYFILDYN